MLLIGLSLASSTSPSRKFIPWVNLRDSDDNLPEKLSECLVSFQLESLRTLGHEESPTDLSNSFMLSKKPV